MGLERKSYIYSHRFQLHAPLLPYPMNPCGMRYVCCILPNSNAAARSLASVSGSLTGAGLIVSVVVLVVVLVLVVVVLSMVVVSLKTYS